MAANETSSSLVNEDKDYKEISELDGSEKNPDIAETFDGSIEQTPSPSCGISETVQNVLKTRFSNTYELIKVGGTKFGIATGVWFLGYFNFSLLWIFCGVCMLLFLAHRTRNRQVTSEVIKSNTDDPKKFMESVKELYRYNGKHLPSWLYFPDVEKAEWLNRIINQIWPYVGTYVKNLLTEQVQTTIRCSSSMLSGFTFTDVDLGDRAPRISGIKVFDNVLTRRNEIVMDVQITYEGDCNIGISLNHLEAGIRDIRVRGVLRIELHPLLEKMPLVGAVSVAFVHEPTIDFNLTQLANLFDIPGFDSLLRGTISDSVGGIMVLPEKYIVKLCPDIDISKLKFPLPQGVIRIDILEARNLEEKDRKYLGLGGGSDPYVVAKVGHNFKFKSSIQHSINPAWNDSFFVIVTDIVSTHIQFSVYDDDGPLNKADYLGFAKLPVSTVFENGVLDEWIQLSEVSSGTLHVGLEWFDLSSDPHDLEKALNISESRKNEVSAFLNIYVDSAQHLPDNQQDSFDPSPCVKITLPGKEPIKTQVIPHTNHPVWEENFRVLLHNPLFDQILFEVDNSIGEVGNMGLLRYSLKNLLHEKDMTVDRPFTLQGGGPNTVLNLRLSLRIFKAKHQTDAPISSSDITPRASVASTLSAVDEANESLLDVPPTPSPKPNDVASGDANVTPSIEFVDKTLQAFYVGTPESPPYRSDESSKVGRSPSVSSEISNVAAVDNLRKRLNAKLKTENGSETANFGLGRIMLTIRHSKNSLIVLVVKAENLIACDEDDNTSDPYVRVYIMPDKKNRLKTKVIKNSLNPVFDQKLNFEITAKDAARRKLHITVKNQTGFLSSEKVLMGEAIIDLRDLDLHQPTTEWYNLKPEANGS